MNDDYNAFTRIAWIVWVHGVAVASSSTLHTQYARYLRHAVLQYNSSEMSHALHTPIGAYPFPFSLSLFPTCWFSRVAVSRTWSLQNHQAGICWSRHGFACHQETTSAQCGLDAYHNILHLRSTYQCSVLWHCNLHVIPKLRVHIFEKDRNEKN